MLKSIYANPFYNTAFKDPNNLIDLFKNLSRNTTFDQRNYIRAKMITKYTLLQI